MKKIISKSFLSLSIALLAMGAISGQSITLIKGESSVTVSGTSSLHDWHETAGDFTATVRLQTNEGTSSEIEQVTFVCKSASLTSENSIMTDKTHVALQAKKYPEIIFISEEPITITVPDGEFSGVVTGELNLNGVGKNLSFPVKGTFKGDRLTASGSQALKMSDYNIKSPTAMLGTLKTGDEVTVHFDLKFQVTDIK
jgi:polyisoprenoid-binding protein YceI